jgi:hypothetical protein
MGPRKLTSSFPTKLLCYNFSIGALVTRQTKLYLGNFYYFFFNSFILSLSFKCFWRDPVFAELFVYPNRLLGEVTN